MKFDIRHLTGLLIAIMLLGAPFAARAGDDEPAIDRETKASKFYTQEVKDAVAKALAFLASTQHKDGCWEDLVGYKINYEVKGQKGPHVGVTALACMAFMADGNTPTRGEYCKNLKSGLNFLLDHVTSNGYITEYEMKEVSSRMYGNAFATMALAEATGMLSKTEREDFEFNLRLAADLIVKSQHKDGGWRYTPGALDEDSDLSVTVSTLQALRAARNVGIHVPKGTVDKAVAYIKKLYEPRDGSFLYQDPNSMMTRTSFALTACGVVALQASGDYYAKEIDDGIKFLAENFAEVDLEDRLLNGRPSFHYFYSHYYGVQAFYLYGGRRWEEYYSSVSRQLIDYQRDDGSMPDPEVGPNYGTAMGVLVLAIPNGYLPIAQR